MLMHRRVLQDIVTENVAHIGKAGGVCKGLVTSMHIAWLYIHLPIGNRLSVMASGGCQ